ncbi:hypothetical protein, partial [Marinomonas sp.]|uniref:hypothetical protein n=1 Tax=Marinomonas sp. TaxID=1904862 RepID=UPI003A94393E
GVKAAEFGTHQGAVPILGAITTPDICPQTASHRQLQNTGRPYMSLLTLSVTQKMGILYSPSLRLLYPLLDHNSNPIAK